ncbi:hypothetical protein [Nonomuraea sp. MG754425]|nr:hypothetical protein [Nonomuraea sp. MG754425]
MRQRLSSTASVGVAVETIVSYPNVFHEMTGPAGFSPPLGAVAAPAGSVA